MKLTQSLPLVLTLRLDTFSFAAFDDLRRRYFPPGRNFIPAHVTLFHALPGEQEKEIVRFLHELCSQSPVLNLCFSGVRFLGSGVAIEVTCPGLLKLHRHFSSEWKPWLGAQDKGGYRPHITIQNKVDPADARRLFERMREEWVPFAGKAEGLYLWHYRGGPWEFAGEFSFEKQDA